MNKSVSRIVVLIAALAAVLSVFGTAEAQYEPVNPQAGLYQPPPSTANSPAFGFGGLNPQPSADAGSGSGSGGSVGGTGGGLAHTGSETDFATAIAIGLLAIGGTAVVASRKREQD